MRIVTMMTVQCSVADFNMIYHALLPKIEKENQKKKNKKKENDYMLMVNEPYA